jgi:hypothetical protein
VSTTPHLPTKQTERLITALRVDAEPPWESCLIPVSRFPVPPDERASLVVILRMLSGEFLRTPELSAEVLLQFNQIHVENGATLLSERGRSWMPQPGLGVWPDREPPTLWTKEDFEMLPIGARPRPLSYQVFRISGAQSARDEARDVMLGRGSIIEIVVEGPSQDFLKQSKEVLLPKITERAFRSYGLYVPLIDRKSIEASGEGKLANWLAGATAYVRESVEDQGILVISSQPIGPIMERMGGRFEEKPAPHWQIPWKALID